MDDKKRKYPFDFNDKEIFEEVGIKEDDYDPGASARALRSMVGLTEIQRRSSRKSANWSIILSITVIILSLIAVYFSYNAYRTSVNWQTKQLQILKEIKDELKK